MVAFSSRSEDYCTVSAGFSLSWERGNGKNKEEKEKGNQGFPFSNYV